MSDVLHMAITVTDLEAMSEFYEETLGLEYAHQNDVGGQVNYYVTGNSSAEIQFIHSPDAEPSPDRAAMDHIAIQVDDVDGTVEHATEQWDSEVAREPMTVDDLDVRIAFITDPEGYVVELVEVL